MHAALKKRLPIFILLLIVGGVSAYWYQKPNQNNDTLTLYGNIDIRQVQAAFYDSGRILSMNVQEGDIIKKGQVLAQLDKTRFQQNLDQNKALVSAQQQILNRLIHGSRPEEIAQAQADVEAARATLINAKITYQRQKELLIKQYVPKQNVDNALAALNSAQATFDRAQQTLKLAVEGPRKEDIETARHQLQSTQAALALATQELSDTELLAPDDGIIQSRILEPGDMVTPQNPVFTLALDNPLWVRAYLPEKSLGLVHAGMSAEIISDSFPNQPFSGWVGFISPTAEFTPKNVETTDLRTELVYRVRVYACNPDHRLRLGMPITVHIAIKHNDPHPLGSNPCDK